MEDIKFLRLPYIRDHYDELLMEAEDQKKSYGQFLNEAIQLEAAQRRENGLQKRISEAHFPSKLLLADFQMDHLHPEVQKSIRILSTLNFINRHENVLLVGNPGVGKTCLACALGLKACTEYKSVLFVRVSDLLIELKEAMSQERINRYKKKFANYDLVILDELGYSSFSKEAEEILFNLLNDRNEKGSIIVTSNLFPAQWNKVFHDEMMSAALTDRLMHKCYALDMTGDSFRLLETQAWMKEAMEEPGKKVVS